MVDPFKVILRIEYVYGCGKCNEAHRRHYQAERCCKEE